MSEDELGLEESVIKRNIQKAVPDLDGKEISTDKTLQDLGIDSLDSVQILFDCLKDLGLKSVDVDLFRGQSIRRVAELLGVARKSLPRQPQETAGVDSGKSKGVF